MNINIIYKENENIWQYVKVCDRCRKQSATVVKDDRKPVENEIHICKSCAFKMFSNEQTREYYWILPKQKLPTEGQEVEFIAKHARYGGKPKRRRFQGYFKKIEDKSVIQIFLAHSPGWSCEFLIDEVEYWMPKVPMPEEKK